jgi:peptide methionine sulfoxide reductase MsrB
MREQHARRSAGHTGHVLPAATDENNTRILKNSAGLTGVYFSAVRLETKCRECGEEK